MGRLYGEIINKRKFFIQSCFTGKNGKKDSKKKKMTQMLDQLVVVKLIQQ